MQIRAAVPPAAKNLSWEFIWMLHGASLCSHLQCGIVKYSLNPPQANRVHCPQPYVLAIFCVHLQFMRMNISFLFFSPLNLFSHF